MIYIKNKQIYLDHCINYINEIMKINCFNLKNYKKSSSFDLKLRIQLKLTQKNDGCNKFIIIHMFPKKFPKFSENFKSFQKFSEFSEIFRKFQKFLEIFRKFQKFSESFRKFQKISENFRKFLKVSENFDFDNFIKFIHIHKFII